MAAGDIRTLFSNLKLEYGTYESAIVDAPYYYRYKAKATVDIFVADYVAKGAKISGRLTVLSSIDGYYLNNVPVTVVYDGSGTAKLWASEITWHETPTNTITTRFEWTNPYAGKIDTGSNAATVDPPALPKSTARVIGTPTFGEAIQIAFSNSQSRARHKLYYYDNNGNIVTVATNIESVYNWTIPMSIANYLTDAPCYFNLIAEEYDPQWSNQYVAAQNLGMNILPNDSMKPSLSLTVSDTSTAIANKFGKFVKGKSKVKTVVAFTGKNNATLKSGTLKKGTETLNITRASQTLTFQGVVDSTSFNIVGKVTDSRNQSTTVTSAQTAYDWEAPKVTTFKVTRCNQDGTTNDAGEYAKVQFNVSISPCGNKNDKALQIQYKKRADSNWTSQSITMSGYTLNSNIIVPADTESVYDFKINLTDYFQTTTAQVYLSTAFTLMDFHKGGKGMAIGKVAENANELDVGIQSRFRKGINSDIGWAVLRNKETQNDFSTLYFYSNDGNDDIYDGCFIRAYDDDENGSIFVMRSGGAFIAGGGEFASSYYADNKSSLAGTEHAFFGADSAVNIIAGYNTPANAKQWTFSGSGNITTPSGGLINGKDITKLAGFYTANTTSAQVGQTTDNRVVVRTNGSKWNESGLIAHDTTINLYDYTAGEQVWRINITKGDTINISNINNRISNGNLSPTYQGTDITLYGIWAGHVTNSNTSLDFFIPLQKALLPEVQKAGVAVRSGTTMDLSVRGPNGYLNSKQYLDFADIGVPYIMAKYSYGVYIRIDSENGAWTNIPNNRPVSVQGRIVLST